MDVNLFSSTMLKNSQSGSVTSNTNGSSRLEPMTQVFNQPEALKALDSPYSSDSDSDMVRSASEAKQTALRAELDNSRDSGEVGEEVLDQTINALNTQFAKANNVLHFEQDPDTEQMILLVKNNETDEVIRQIPSNEFLSMAKNITEFLASQQQLSDKSAIPAGLLTHETA